MINANWAVFLLQILIVVPETYVVLRVPLTCVYWITNNEKSSILLDHCDVHRAAFRVVFKR